MAFQLHFLDLDPRLRPDNADKVPHMGINPEYVISRDKDGEVRSRFKENIWDFRAYGMSSALHFDSWWNNKSKGPMDALARTITNELKTIIWLSAFETTSNSGRSRGSGHIYLSMPVLRAVAKIAHKMGTTLSDSHLNSKFQVALRSSISSVSDGLANMGTLGSTLKDLAYWQGVDSIEYHVPRIIAESQLHDVLALIKKIQRKQQEDQQRTPLIPTRLFAKLIGGAMDQLKAAQPNLPKLEALVKAVYTDPTLFVGLSMNGFANNIRRVQCLYPDRVFSGNTAEERANTLSVHETLARFALTEYAERAGITCLRSLAKHLNHLHTLACIMIHAFTGMRASEVQVMPFEPVVDQAAKGFGDLPVLVSHLKKLTKRGNYSNPLVWATSKEGLFAVDIAQKLTRIQWFRNRPEDESLPKNIPLFVAANINRVEIRGHYAVPINEYSWNTKNWRAVSESLDLVVEPEDLEELVVFDAIREWDEDPDFQVGKLWPLSSHQCRRSVAVYASRSGMVSLPTLKTQFKHLSAVMTALYAENSSYAASFLMDESGRPIDNDSVLQSYRDAIAFNTSIRFHEQVIKSENTLYGTVGGEIQRAKEAGILPRMYDSREAVEKAVKQGRIAYKDTPVGGCTLKGSCPNFAVDVVLPCTSGCKDAILMAEKLEVYVDSLRFDMQAQSPKSKPYQLIGKEIEYVTNTYLKSEEV